MSIRYLVLVGVVAFSCLLPLAGCNNSPGGSSDGGAGGGGSTNTTSAE